MRHDVEAILAQSIAQIPRCAIEHRITGRQHNDPLLRRGIDLAHDRVQIAADLDLLGRRSRHRLQRLFGAHQQLCPLYELLRRRGKPFQPVVADADNIDFRC